MNLIDSARNTQRQTDFPDIIERFLSATILVVGDVMLDI
jgi:hypothetical protein